MLGLGDYDSPSVEGESPAPANAEGAAAEPVPVGTQSLSIVDYYDGEGEAEPAAADNGTGVLGVTLDDEAVQQATQRRVGGVQISVLKKNAAALPGAHGSTRAMPTATKEREREDATHAAAGRVLALVRTTGGGRGQQRSVGGRKPETLADPADQRGGRHGSGLLIPAPARRRARSEELRRIARVDVDLWRIHPRIPHLCWPVRGGIDTRYRRIIEHFRYARHHVVKIITLRHTRHHVVIFMHKRGRKRYPSMKRDQRGAARRRIQSSRRPHRGII